jgi:hypothetical protein
MFSTARTVESQFLLVGMGDLRLSLHQAVKCGDRLLIYVHDLGRREPVEPCG